MGYDMATNVRKKMDKNSKLYVYDVNPAACERFSKELASEGEIVTVDSAKEIAENADTIISMVPAAQHVKAVYLDQKSGVIRASKSSKRLILECSTIDSQSTKDVGEALHDADLGTYVDTPVSVCELVRPASIFQGSSFASREVQQAPQLGRWPS